MTARPIHFVAVLFAALVLSGCVTTPVTNPTRMHGAFFTKDRILVGTYDQFQSQLAQAIPDPANTNLVIFNHGTEDSGRNQVCKPSKETPLLFMLMPARISDTVVYSFCSNQVGGGSEAPTEEQTYFRRGQEIALLLDQLAAYGLNRDRIVLAGHSGGAASILSTAVRWPGKFNYFIASAPGYGYAYAVHDKSDFRVNANYEAWKEHYETGRNLNGLILAFRGDRYAPVEDVTFLSRKEGVEFRAYGEVECGGFSPHAFIASPCFDEDERQHIYSRVIDHLAARGISVSLETENRWPGHLWFPEAGKDFSFRYTSYGMIMTPDGAAMKGVWNHGDSQFRRILKDFPDDSVLVVYTDGKGFFGKKDSFCNKPSQLPAGLRALVDPGERDSIPVGVYYYCPPQQPDEDDLDDESIAARYLLNLARALVMIGDSGIQPDRLFLMGHGSGGSATLLAAAGFHSFVGGAIASGPILSAKDKTDEAAAKWERVFNVLDHDDARGTTPLQNLIIAFENDTYSPPQDLEKIGGLDGFSYILAPECPTSTRDNHDRSGVRRCLKAPLAEKIRAFVTQAVADAPKNRVD